MIVGTSYFRSRDDAIAYYADYEDRPARAVDRKLSEGEIHIGKPEQQPGERLFLIDHNRRWAIETI